VSAAPTVSLLDWGAGGFDLLARLRAARPDLRLRYRSDAGFEPWGRLPPPALAARVAEIVAQEQDAGADAVLLACNAASTALPALRHDGVGAGLRFGLHGVIEPGVAAALATGAERIGVLGGRRTIVSGGWARPLRAAGRQVQGRVAQPLSARIETGDCDGPQTRALVQRLCAPLRDRELVVLACTHYPAAEAAIAAALPGVALLDPAQSALAALLAALPAAAAGAEAAPTWAVFTSGDPSATQRAARLAFGVETGEVRLAVDASRR
jgi:glutamate racemase